jgi:tripartite-type tricarboxylate transporter receptor subunit TctC
MSLNDYKPMTKRASRTALTRRAFSCAAGGVLICPSLLANQAVFAQTFPAGIRIKLVCGSDPGSISDIVGRIVAEQLQSELGVTVYTENRPGASGIVAARSIVLAPADGHTLYITSGAHTVAPLVNKVDYDPVADFSGVATLAVVTDVLVASVASGFRSVADLISAAKAKPGQLNCASAGLGSASYMSAEKFRLATGLNVVHVPFKGPVAAINELLAGRIDYYFAPLASALPLIETGKLTALAVGSEERSDLLPDIPTLSEAGVENANYLFWIGLLVSSKTPSAVISMLNRSTLKALGVPSVRTAFQTMGLSPLLMTPPQFDEMMWREMIENAQIIKAGKGNT